MEIIGNNSSNNNDQRRKKIKHTYRISNDFTSNKTSKSSGCLIIQDNKIVFIWSPFNFHNVWCTGKFSVPDGLAEPGSLAWETAAKETLEETGIAVEILDEINDFGDFILFLAKPINKIEQSHIDNFYKKYEISKITLTEPQNMPIAKARFKKQHEFIMEWYNKNYKIK